MGEPTTEINEEQLHFVFDWLRQKYSNAQKAIPPFEVTPFTISTLYEIAIRNVERDNDLEVLRKDLEQKTIEYNAEGFYSLSFPLSLESLISFSPVFFC
jgi:hypothetical protein